MVQNIFFSDGLQNHLVFEPINKYLSFFSGMDKNYSRISRGVSEEN